jgi:hypothetical protein
MHDSHEHQQSQYKKTQELLRKKREEAAKQGASKKGA